MTTQIEGRIYRAVALGDRWQKSEFEYFSTITNAWRRVNNWDRRAQLFSVFTQIAA